MISLTPLTPLVSMNMSSVTASQKNEQKQILVIIKPLILVARGVLAHLGLEVGLEHRWMQQSETTCWILVSLNFDSLTYNYTIKALTVSKLTAYTSALKKEITHTEHR